MSVLSKIRSAGFSVALSGGDVIVSPFSALSDSQVAFLKANKASIVDELVAELRLASVSNDGLQCIAFTPLGEPVQVVAKSAEHRHWVVVMNPPMTLQ